MVANNPPIIHVARIDTSAGGVPQVYQLPATQILSVQDGNDLPSAVLEGPSDQSFTVNRVCEFLDDRYCVQGDTLGVTNGGVFKRNSGGDGVWGRVHTPPAPLGGDGEHFNLSGLVVLHPDGVPTMAYWYYEDDGTNAADPRIAFTTDGTNWTEREGPNLISNEQPVSVGEAVVFRRSVFWPHSVEIPLSGSTRRTISAHDLELNSFTNFTLFDRISQTGAELSLVVHRNKMFAFGIRDNVAAGDGIRYELRRLDGGSFGGDNSQIHAESSAGGGQYPGALFQGHAAMFTDPASGQLIIIMSGGQSTGTTVASAGGAKVLRFATADTDVAGDDAGVDISSIVMGDLGDPTGAGGADKYLTGGSGADLSLLWHVVVDNQTVPGATARVFLWVASLGSDTECWEWKGIDAEMEPVAGLIGIMLNEFVLSNIVTGGGQYYPRIGAVELEGNPQEVAGGTKIEFRGRGPGAQVNDVVDAGVVTFYSNAEEEAPVTVVPIVGSLTCASGLLINLEAYYKLNNSGVDSSPNGSFDLTFTGVEAYVSGLFGSAYDLPGNEANFAEALPSGTNVLDHAGAGAKYTISAWVDPTTLSTVAGFSSVVGKVVGSNGWEIIVLDDGAVRFANNGVTAATTATGVITVSTSGFQHIIVVSDGVRMKIFVDDVEEADVAFFTNNAISQALRIGDRVTSDSPWDGALDEIALWSRNLSTIEITNLFNLGVGRELESLITTPSIVGNTIINFTLDGGLCSVILNTNAVGISEGDVGTLVGNLVV